MTSAGAAEVAMAVEDGFRTLPGTPTWFQPGENVQVQNASLENALERARQPDDPRPDGSREGNREVAFSVTFALTDLNFHDLVFPATSPVGLARSASKAPSFTTYLAAETLPGTEERFIEGCAVESLTLNYQQGGDVTVDLTIIGATETDSPSTPGTIQQPSKDQIVRFHGTDYQINAGVVEELQSLSVSVSGMARFRRGQQREPTDVVVGAYTPQVTQTATLRDNEYLSLAYGSAGATSPETTIDESSGTLTFTNPNGQLVEYDLIGLQPDSYEWSDLVAPETDITDPVTYHMKDLQVV